jgi:hypothetical protein
LLSINRLARDIISLHKTIDELLDSMPKRTDMNREQQMDKISQLETRNAVVTEELKNEINQAGNLLLLLLLLLLL